MGKFNNKDKAEMPELNTSSLPDLIFSILFFFMIVTSMREEEVKVEFKAPKGTELNKLEKKTAGVNVYIGESKAGEKTGKSVIQINDGITPLKPRFQCPAVIPLNDPVIHIQRVFQSGIKFFPGNIFPAP